MLVCPNCHTVHRDDQPSVNAGSFRCSVCSQPLVRVNPGRLADNRRYDPLSGAVAGAIIGGLIAGGLGAVFGGLIGLATGESRRRQQ
jgi:uncharacterized membrane protein